MYVRIYIHMYIMFKILLLQSSSLSEAKENNITDIATIQFIAKFSSCNNVSKLANTSPFNNI